MASRCSSATASGSSPGSAAATSWSHDDLTYQRHLTVAPHGGLVGPERSFRSGDDVNAPATATTSYEERQDAANQTAAERIRASAETRAENVENLERGG